MENISIPDNGLRIKVGMIWRPALFVRQNDIFFTSLALFNDHLEYRCWFKYSSPWSDFDTVELNPPFNGKGVTFTYKDHSTRRVGISISNLDDLKTVLLLAQSKGVILGDTAKKFIETGEYGNGSGLKGMGCLGWFVTGFIVLFILVVIIGLVQKTSQSNQGSVSQTESTN